MRTTRSLLLNELNTLAITSALFFVLQRNYQLLDPSAVFCRLSIHLLMSLRPQN